MKPIEFDPDPEGKQIHLAANIAGIEGALEKLEQARKFLEKIHRNPLRADTQYQAEKDYDDAHHRVNWWLR